MAKSRSQAARSAAKRGGGGRVGGPAQRVGAPQGNRGGGGGFIGGPIANVGAPGRRGGAGSTTTTTTTQVPAPPVQPFLTPAQQTAMLNWNLKYGDTLAKLGNSDVQALASFNSKYGGAEFKNAQQTDMTNQQMGARGIFQSSIRDNALNDLAATLASQYNLMHTAYQTTLMNNATSRGTLQGTNDIQQQAFNEQMVQNAQSTPPNTATTPQTTTTTTPNPAATKPPRATKPPSGGGGGFIGGAAGRPSRGGGGFIGGPIGKVGAPGVGAMRNAAAVRAGGAR